MKSVYILRPLAYAGHHFSCFALLLTPGILRPLAYARQCFEVDDNQEVQILTTPMLAADAAVLGCTLDSWRPSSYPDSGKGVTAKLDHGYMSYYGPLRCTQAVGEVNGRT